MCNQVVNLLHQHPSIPYLTARVKRTYGSCRRCWPKIMRCRLHPLSPSPNPIQKAEYPLPLDVWGGEYDHWKKENKRTPGNLPSLNVGKFGTVTGTIDMPCSSGHRGGIMPCTALSLGPVILCPTAQCPLPPESGRVGSVLIDRMSCTCGRLSKRSVSHLNQLLSLVHGIMDVKEKESDTINSPKTPPLPVRYTAQHSTGKCQSYYSTDDKP